MVVNGVKNDPARKRSKIHVSTLFPERELPDRPPVYPSSRPRRSSSKSAIKTRSSSKISPFASDETPTNSRRMSTPLKIVKSTSISATEYRERIEKARQELAEKLPDQSINDEASEDEVEPVPWQLIDLPHPDWDELNDRRHDGHGIERFEDDTS